MIQFFFSCVFALMLGGALLVALAGIGYVISIPCMVVLYHYFPRLRPVQLPPIYVNLHRRHDTTDYNLVERTPRAPVKPSPYVLEESGFYKGERVETEKFPIVPIAESVGESFGLSDMLEMQIPAPPITGPIIFGAAPMVVSNGNDHDLIHVRRRVLLGYLRKHSKSPKTDAELLRDFLSTVSKQRRARFL
jgi:hypothetical protein